MRISIIGSGLMGKGLTQIFSQCPRISHVSWIGRDLIKLKHGIDELLAIWQKLISKGKISKDDSQFYLNKIEVTQEMECLERSDIIIEAVKECISTKISIFREISQRADTGTLIASNTSSLSITELAGATRCPENVVGLHFFNPPALMQLVEVVVGLKTSEKTIARSKEIVSLLGKEPIVVKEAPGFIVNRMLIPMINEAIGLLAEGVAEAKDIDKAMTLGANHPLGPLALADLIGNDVILAIMETLRLETGDPKYRPHPLLRKMVRAQLLGRKTNQGFYSYFQQI